MELSERTRSISASLTLAITAKAKAMKKKGESVLNLGAGEPDFDTPYFIKEATKQALNNGFTKYTPSSGIKELKEAISKKYEEEYNLKYSPEEIIVSCGAKHALFNAMMALINKGDEVIIPSPYWVSYPEMVKFTEGKPVIVKTEEKNDFKLTPSQLEKAITKKTKILIVNTPSNPCGSVYKKEELKSIARILIKHKIFCLFDEIYEKIIYKTSHINIATLSKKMKELSIVINGVSKTFSMTGFRIGWALARKELVQAMTSIQSHSTSNPTSFSQKGALFALKSKKSKKIVEKMVKEFKKRRDYVVEAINSIKGLSCLRPEGAFYVFVNISSLLNKPYKGNLLKTSLEFAKILLEEKKLAVIPGIAFGNDNYIRISYAASIKDLKNGIQRLQEFVNEIKKD
ncbi:MAG: aspartate aminotransferase [Candidatus Omnitrophica bacterium 4484_70.1]|nr:MAG: aspartate aminotransferase [Candidatus Omnitrophica bacterium 4484_70.1]